MENKIETFFPPYIHSGNSIRKSMGGVLVALIPAFLMGVYLFRVDALIVTALSVLSCVGFEYAAVRFMLKKESSIPDLSAVVTGVLLAFSLPATIPLWQIPIGALAAIGAGKMLFGGLGKNIFNPALVGYVALLLFFPSQMRLAPAVEASGLVDGVTSATALAELQRHSLGDFSISRMFFGVEGGSIGETSALALLLGFAYLLWRKIISWQIPISIFLAVLGFSGILWLADPLPQYNPVHQLLSGGLMLGAIFMATDWVTSPMTKKGRVIYGAGIGLVTVCIRLWSGFPEGVAFAILLMNAFTPVIDKLIKPRRFWKYRKKA